MFIIIFPQKKHLPCKRTRCSRGTTIIPVIIEALEKAQVTPDKLDAIAVTQGPGLIGSLLVGVETAKVLSTIWQKPLIPINHLIGHFYANWIIPETTDEKFQMPQFPSLGLLVSGGHSDIILMTAHGKYQYIGGTRDDAAGECFDKSARIMGLPYPGGPVVSKLAKEGDPKTYPFPRPMADSGDFDFSFSGLKTAVLNTVSQLKNNSDEALTDQEVKNLCASLEAAIVDILVKKTLKAAEKYEVDQVIVAGGVAVNQKLKEELTRTISDKLPRALLHIPKPKLCTDNAAYIGAAAIYNWHEIEPFKLQADPNLSLT